jgi:surface antigen
MRPPFITTVLLQAISLSCLPPLTSAYPVKADTLNCRSGPGTSYSIKKTYQKGDDVKLSCQTTGTSVEGTTIWDKTTDGCYVSDYYVKTGTDGFVTDKCGSSKPAPAKGGIPGPVKDDYPSSYKSSCGKPDRWKYWTCQCTSFVAWRINERLDVKFNNNYKGVHWGDAKGWDEAAKKSGVTINNTPVPGAIAQSSENAGHVAWVTKVSDGKVTVEEYNFEEKEGYGKRTVAKGKFKYIHIKV